MNSADPPLAKTRFSIRSLLTFVAFSAVVFIAVKQHRQNQRMQLRIEALSSQVEHIDASIEDTREKFELLKDIVSNEPALGVQQVSRAASR
jgi:dephospho-CoA kinase